MFSLSTGLEDCIHANVLITDGASLPKTNVESRIRSIEKTSDPRRSVNHAVYAVGFRR